MRDYVKYAGILFAITLVTALLLGVVNNFTAPVIEKNTEKKLTLAIESVVEGKIDTSTAKSFDPQGETTVTEITSYINDADKTVYAVRTSPTGYGGDIEMIVGLNDTGMVTGVEIINMSETPGLGAAAKGNEKWLSQFLGEGKEQLDAITGATITSKAVRLGVDDARQQVLKITGGAEVE